LPQLGASLLGLAVGVHLFIALSRVAADALARLVLSGAFPFVGAALDFSDSLVCLGEAGTPGPRLGRRARRTLVFPERLILAVFRLATAVFEPVLSNVLALRRRRRRRIAGPNHRTVVPAPSSTAARCTFGPRLRLGAQALPQLGASLLGLAVGVHLFIALSRVAADALARLVLSGAFPFVGAALDFSDSLVCLGEAGTPGPRLGRRARRTLIPPERFILAVFRLATAVFEPVLCRLCRRRFFAVRRAIVDKRSRAIATRSDSVRARACALAVTAAVFHQARVYTLRRFHRIRIPCR